MLVRESPGSTNAPAQLPESGSVATADGLGIGVGAGVELGELDALAAADTVTACDGVVAAQPAAMPATSSRPSTLCCIRGSIDIWTLPTGDAGRATSVTDRPLSWSA